MIRRYPAVFLLAFIVAGVVVADTTHASAWFFLVITLLAAVLGVYLLAQSRFIPASILLPVCVGAFAGFHFAARYYDTGPRHLSKLLVEPAVYRVYGRVSDWPDLKPNRTEIKISLDSIGGEVTSPVDGSLLLKISDTTTVLQRGDRIEFTGRIYPLIDREQDIGFDYQRYLNLRGISAIVYLPTLLDVRVDRRNSFGFFRAIDDLRDAILGSFQRNLEPTQAALASGFLIGETRGIPSSVYSMFRDSGTLHLLAVSGSNVALVLLVAVFVLRPFALSRRKRSAVLLGIIVIFAALSYGEPSVIRASVMAGLVITAGLIQRRYDLNNVIALTAVIILLVDPGQFYDIGFQLSFVTAWGLIYAVPRISCLFDAYHNRRWYRWGVFPAIVALVAQIASTPLVAVHFNRVPVISVFANLLIVPLVSLAVVALVIMLLADLVWPVLGLFAGSLVNVLLSVVLKLLHALGGENMMIFKPAGIIPEHAMSWLMIGLYAVMMLILFSMGKTYLRKVLLIAGLLVVNVTLMVAAVGAAGDQAAEVEITTVPGGAAVLISRSSSGTGDLVLTGLQAADYAIDEKIIRPWFESRGVRKLNSVFIVSCEYGAVDDVLRLAGSFEASGIYIRQSLKSSLSDVVAISDDLAGQLPPIIGYAARLPDDRGLGIAPSELGILIQSDGYSVLVTDRVSEALFRWEPAGNPYDLVVGERWQPSAADWISLHSRGAARIICSKIAPHFQPAVGPAEINPDLTPPDYLFDLNRLGSIRLSRGK